MYLTTLPPEILSQIFSYLEVAQSVSRLSLTCRSLHAFVELEGWKIFVQSRFPSIATGPYWRHASQALAALSRNWDRRSVLARNLGAAGSVLLLPNGQWTRSWSQPRGQTMGYQPYIDGFEEQTGPSYGSIREVLAWSIGAGLALRLTEKGPPAFNEWEKSSKTQRLKAFDQHRQKIDWLVYKEKGYSEGRDDITTLKLLRPHQRSRNAYDASAEEMVIGRANGDLQLLRLSTSSSAVSTVFETNGLSVRSADIGSEENPLLAACLDDAVVRLYQVRDAEEHTPNIAQSEIKATQEDERRCRTWSCRFLSDRRLAIGRGISAEHVHVYDIAADGLSTSPLRTFGRMEGTREWTSAYALEAIPFSSIAGSATGNTFFAGCYDGSIRLHDLRSPRATETSFCNLTDSSAIFSLQMLGRERLVAGGAKHNLLQIYDLRMMGGRAYDYVNATPTQPRQNSHINGQRSQERKDNLKITGLYNWNMFLNPNNRSARGPLQGSRSFNSPVYSICSPSPSSFSLYAGTENRIVQLDFIDSLDKHQDPTLVYGLQRTKCGGLHAKNTWNSKGEILNLDMYENRQDGQVVLFNQRGVGHYSDGLLGYDARWQKV